MHKMVQNVLVRFFTHTDKLAEDVGEEAAKDPILSKYVRNFKKICVGFCLAGAAVILFSSIGPVGTVIGIILCIACPIVVSVYGKRLRIKVMGEGVVSDEQK